MKKTAVKKNTREAVVKKKTVDKRIKVADEVYFAACDLYANGESLKNACKANGISRIAFYERTKKNSELLNQYTRAREYAGDACLDKIHDFEEMLKAGQIDSSSANVLIQTEKWKAQKYYPKMYGDTVRTQMIDDSGKGINPFAELYKAICNKKDYTPQQ